MPCIKTNIPIIIGIITVCLIEIPIIRKEINIKNMNCVLSQSLFIV